MTGGWVNQSISTSGQRAPQLAGYRQVAAGVPEPDRGAQEQHAAPATLRPGPAHRPRRRRRDLVEELPDRQVHPHRLAPVGQVPA
ncbi:MAG: hypothetical protein L0H84_11210, partial [Pseudonocardia sp.]|nr:hypothetical protein [Pseudonocardia sp.]